ncbi:minor capsid protein [Jeotgalibaca porci]|uniref:minor capsid protein n=1 Tax=Jeotgalibaca porci TaxID=1868793 RepID=UPI0035A18F94
MTPEEIKRRKQAQLAYERERKAMNDLAMREFDRERAIEAIHKQHIETIQEQIDGFYMRYAGSEGLTRAEAMKRADQMDVTAFANKAKKAVKEKDFSPETNEWLKTYNLKMKVSRLELLKEEINWELIQMYDKDYQLISESLREEARLELERQAGILGNSAKGAVKRIEGIVNADFYGKNFSERVWGRTGLYQSTQKEVFKSLNKIYATMDGYRRERNRLMERMGTTEYETMRLLRTENARIGSQMQVEAYKANEFEYYVFVNEPGACDICEPMGGKVFAVKDAEIGRTLKPLHPLCRCSSYGYIPMQRKVNGVWIDEVPERI